jgi:hypothetical protein
VVAVELGGERDGVDGQAVVGELAHGRVVVAGSAALLAVPVSWVRESTRSGMISDLGDGNPSTVEQLGVHRCPALGIPLGPALVVDAFDQVAAIPERQGVADDEFLVAEKRGVDILFHELVDYRVVEAGHGGIIA